MLDTAAQLAQPAQPQLALGPHTTQLSQPPFEEGGSEHVIVAKVGFLGMSLSGIGFWHEDLRSRFLGMSLRSRFLGMRLLAVIFWV